MSSWITFMEWSETALPQPDYIAAVQGEQEVADYIYIYFFYSSLWRLSR